MAVRSIVGANKARNGNFELSPGNIPMTNSLGRWIDGTASGSLVNDTYGWWQITGVGSVAGSFDNSYKHSGSNSLKIDLNATGRGRVMSAPFETTTTKDLVTKYGIPIKANTSYTLNAYVASVNAIAGIGRVILQQYDINGTLLSSTNTTLLPAGTNDWTLLTVTLTTNAAAAYAVINCNCNTAGQAQTYWFDDIYFNKTIPDTRTTTTSRTLASNRVLTRDMGTALSFDGGVGNFVDIPDAGIPVSSLQNGFTVAAWIKPKTPGSGGTGQIMDKSTGTNGLNGFRFSTNSVSGTADSTGRVVATGPSGSSRFSADGSIKWNVPSLAVVSVTSAGVITMYVNGVVSGTPGATGALSGMTATTPMRFGNRAGATDRAFNGIMDEPRIWTRALTATEVANMYFNNAIPRNGLVGEWLFNETTGTTALDSSGNGNNGTITGATYTTDTPLRTRNSV